MYSRRSRRTNWFQIVVVFALGMMAGQLFNINLALEPRTEPPRTERRTR